LLKGTACGINDERGKGFTEGRLINRELGEYKGYPLERDEWPAEVFPSHD
jgi:hypothetical protein